MRVKRHFELAHAHLTVQINNRNNLALLFYPKDAYQQLSNNNPFLEESEAITKKLFTEKPDLTKKSVHLHQHADGTPLEYKVAAKDPKGGLEAMIKFFEQYTEKNPVLSEEEKNTWVKSVKSLKLELGEPNDHDYICF